MSKSRGNRNSKAAIEERRRKIASSLPSSQTDLAKELGVSRVTVWRDLSTLIASVNETPSSLELFKQYREKIRGELEGLKRVAMASADLDDQARIGVLLKVNEALMRLLGLDDPQLVRASIEGTQEQHVVKVEYAGPEHTLEVWSPRMLPESSLPPPREPEPERTVGDIIADYQAHVRSQEEGS